MCYPYTYTDLNRYLSRLERDPAKSKLLRRRALCDTIAGNPCEVLTITNADHPHVLASRRVVVISARVHPGETVASYMMRGVIEYLLGTSGGAGALREAFIFKVIPMMNPDGVINGNYRTNLSGHDLNRRWLSPRRHLHPTVWHCKELIRKFSLSHGVEMFVDLHGHSKKMNCFIYGCASTKQLIAQRQGAAGAGYNEIPTHPTPTPEICMGV